MRRTCPGPRLPSSGLCSSGFFGELPARLAVFQLGFEAPVRALVKPTETVVVVIMIVVSESRGVLAAQLASTFFEAPGSTRTPTRE